MTEPNAMNNSRTGASATGLCFTSAAFKYAQSNFLPIQQLHKADVNPIGKGGIGLKGSAQLGHRGAPDVVDQGNSVRVAHG
jgi:hypothetical protein